MEQLESGEGQGPSPTSRGSESTEDLDVPAFLMDIFKLYYYLLFFLSFFLTYHRACGILASQPRIEPTPPAVEVRSLNHWTAREVPTYCFQNLFVDFLRGVSPGPGWELGQSREQVR